MFYCFILNRIIVFFPLFFIVLISIPSTKVFFFFLCANVLALNLSELRWIFYEFFKLYTKGPRLPDLRHHLNAAPEASDTPLPACSGDPSGALISSPIGHLYRRSAQMASDWMTPAASCGSLCASCPPALAWCCSAERGWGGGCRNTKKKGRKKPPSMI